MHVNFLPDFVSSDQMGNKGAFITMGADLKPNFTSYDAVVSDPRNYQFAYSS